MAKNFLSGTIPVSLGSLPTLISLNLSENQLLGQIPKSLSNLKLNLLDFLNNQLMGAIPDSLSLDAYKGSFAENNGFCSKNIKNFHRCYGESGKPKEQKQKNIRNNITNVGKTMGRNQKNLRLRCHSDSTKDSTHIIAGTHGFTAPEYGYTHNMNEKNDVYSFGVVLIELISWKRPIEPEYKENNNIVKWEDKIKVLIIVIVCTTRLPTLRRTMRNVVQMLDDVEPYRLVGIIVRKDDGGNKVEKLKDHTKM
ncbi:Receptor-like protein kinase HAIKU2 [Capsicum chinense]|nr:Receptor-like protein kinase HAIKU2 [Capsicum chinense]